MKKRKKQIANLLKLGVFLFGISLLLWNCEQEEDKVLLKEIQQEQTVTHISLDEFKKKIIQNSSFKKFSLFFDMNQSHSTISQKNTSNSSDTIVLTNNITRIKKDGFSTYTFRVLTNNNDDSIYNLVVYVNGNNEIYKSHILKYIPSNEWRVNPSSYFTGKVFLVNNNLFNTSNLVFAKDADCLTGGTTYWECSFGFNHAPGTCNATSYEYVIDLEYGECDNGGNDDGVIINPTNPSEGGSSGGGADGGIVTAPDTTPYTQELKDFVSGTLNLADEGVKSYYTSNSNITNTINNYLIQKGFSDFSKFEAMLNLEFGFSLGLNYESFVWAFNNKESEEVKAVKDFLAVNTTTEAKTFVKKVIDIHMGKIEDDIIDETNNPCVGDIIKELQKKDTYGALVPDLKGKGHLSEMVLDLFGECKNYDLTINVAQLGANSQGHPINAETKGIESITLDTDLVKDATKLSIAKTLIHESLHVYINLKTTSYDRAYNLTKNLDKYYQKMILKYPNDVANNLTQHQFMSQFVEAMAYSLSAYDNHQQSMDYYKAMSWGGLESSDAYKKLPNKTAIEKIIKNERYARNDAKSTKCK